MCWNPNDGVFIVSQFDAMELLFDGIYDVIIRVSQVDGEKSFSNFWNQ